MNAEAALHDDGEVRIRSGVARQLLKPLKDNPSQPDAYEELRYELEGDTVFFTFNAQGLKGETFCGLYSGDNLLGMGYAIQSGSLNVQGYRLSEMLKGGDFKLFTIDARKILPDEQVLRLQPDQFYCRGRERRWYLDLYIGKLK